MFTRIVRSIVVLGILLTAVGCASHDRVSREEPGCKDRKPGTIVTVNEYCVIQNDDPVDPAIVVDWKGQKVGFCCKGCLPKWNALTDAQKDDAVRVAVAKGKIPSP